MPWHDFHAILLAECFDIPSYQEAGVTYDIEKYLEAHNRTINFDR